MSITLETEKFLKLNNETNKDIVKKLFIFTYYENNTNSLKNIDD